RDESDDQAEHELDRDGEQRQPESGREGAGENLVDALAAEGRAEVTLKQITEVDQVAREERLIEVELRLERCVLSVGGGLVAEEGEDRVTRQQEHHREDEEGRAEKDRNRLQQSPDDVCGHGAKKLSSGR